MVSGDTVLVLDYDWLSALDVHTGALRWRMDDVTAYSAAIAVDSGQAYIADGAGALRAVDVLTGAEVWRRDVAEAGEYQVFSEPTVVDGVVYVDDLEGEAGNVYALDVGTGGLLWRARTGAMEEYPLPMVDGTVAVTDVDGTLWLFDAVSGGERARYHSGRRFLEAPVMGDGAVYLVSTSGEVEAIGVQDGTQRWATRLGDDDDLSGAVITPTRDGVVLVDIGDGLTALDSPTGAVRWHCECSGRTPVVADGTVYVADADYRLTAIDSASGERRWTSHVAASAWVSAANRLLYTTGDTYLDVLQGDTGRLLWRMRAGAPWASRPVVTADAIFVGGSDLQLHAFDRFGAIAIPDLPAPATDGVRVERLGSVGFTPPPHRPRSSASGAQPFRLARRRRSRPSRARQKRWSTPAPTRKRTSPTSSLGAEPSGTAGPSNSQQAKRWRWRTTVNRMSTCSFSRSSRARTRRRSTPEPSG
jgi:outer membrane protein assembly factor BamB